MIWSIKSLGIVLYRVFLTTGILLLLLFFRLGFWLLCGAESDVGVKRFLHDSLVVLCSKVHLILHMWDVLKSGERQRTSNNLILTLNRPLHCWTSEGVTCNLYSIASLKKSTELMTIKNIYILFDQWKHISTLK